jgi:hypothetical protein
MRYSELDSLYRQDVIDSIKQRWEQLYELEKEWSDKAVKFLFLTNSGGAIALLSFLGTGAILIQSSYVKFGLISFVVGILFVAVIIARAHNHMSYLFESYRKDVNQFYKDLICVDDLYGKDLKRVESFSWQYVFPYASLVCFILGCVLGGISLFGW